MFDDRSGMRPDRLCPLCDRPVFYTGDVDTTAWGDENRSRLRGMYVCKNVDCEKYEQPVEPRMR